MCILITIEQSKRSLLPVNVKSSTYIDFDIENNDKNPKFMVGDQVRISKYKNILQKFAFQIGLKKVL